MSGSAGWMVAPAVFAVLALVINAMGHYSLEDHDTGIWTSLRGRRSRVRELLEERRIERYTIWQAFLWRWRAVESWPPRIGERVKWSSPGYRTLLRLAGETTPRGDGGPNPALRFEADRETR
ncbi:hypothetical protein [Candidatus Palauibacter sp.]|uniref:hypothetical protein n=1 Tax=Candidatus Palauibacter sp. TaxID=3101350 RepID=UPI003CC681D1